MKFIKFRPLAIKTRIAPIARLSHTEGFPKSGHIYVRKQPLLTLECSLAGPAPSQEKKGLVSCLYVTCSSGYVIGVICYAITPTLSIMNIISCGYNIVHMGTKCMLAKLMHHARRCGMYITQQHDVYESDWSCTPRCSGTSRV